MARKMKESGIEWVGVIPEDWNIYRLKSCILSRDAGAWGDESIGDENDYICIRIADFDYPRMTIKKEEGYEYTKRNYKPETVERLLLKKNDILIEKSGGGEKTPVGRTIIFDEDFISKYKKLCKAHKNKRNQGIPNPTTYGTNLHKNIETVIINIKQMSNNFFKIGYLNPVHNICFEFFKLIDSYTPYTLANLIINHVLFFVIHNNPKEKNNKTITNNNIVFNPTSLLSLYGFNTGNVQGPFLPPDDPQKYTLVLDLDETLVHFFYTPSGGSFLIRPHCFDFLEEMSSIFDIAIFTAGMKDYADSILDLLDPEKKWIKYRLYRHHTSLSGMCFVKDLSKLGRDLKKVIIIDNLADNFRLQPNNGLEIKTWTEEMRDSQLKDIGRLLNEIIKQSPSDIRITLKKVKEEYIKRIRKNQMNPYKNISIV